jgi:hypothetical protein
MIRTRRPRPRDIYRSFNIRSRTLLTKALEVHNLDSNINIGITITRGHEKFQFRTSPHYEVTWDNESETTRIIDPQSLLEPGRVGLHRESSSDESSPSAPSTPPLVPTLMGNPVEAIPSLVGGPTSLESSSVSSPTPDPSEYFTPDFATAYSTPAYSIGAHSPYTNNESTALPFDTIRAIFDSPASSGSPSSTSSPGSPNMGARNCLKRSRSEYIKRIQKRRKSNN